MLGLPKRSVQSFLSLNYLNEPIEIIHTERLAPLEVSDRTFPLDQIPKQAALIAFSRQDVLSLAGELREKHGRFLRLFMERYPLRCAGTARRFRDGLADCVVATDAIGWD